MSDFGGDNLADLDPFDFQSSAYDPLNVFKDISEPTNLFDFDFDQTGNKNQDLTFLEQAFDFQEDQQSDRVNETENQFKEQKRKFEQELFSNESSQGGSVTQFNSQNQDNGSSSEGQSKLRKKRKISQFKIADSDQVTKMRQELANIIHSKKFSDEYKKKNGAKLRNRISAQQSRDRQKAILQQLQDQNEQLSKENEQLKSLVAKLQKENETLQKKASNQQRVGLNSKRLIAPVVITMLTVICCLQMFMPNQESSINQRQLSIIDQQTLPQNSSSLISQTWSSNFLSQEKSQIQEKYQQRFLDKFDSEINIEDDLSTVVMYCDQPDVFYLSNSSINIHTFNLVIPNRVFNQTAEGSVWMRLKVLDVKEYFDHERNHPISKDLVSNY